MEKSTEVVNLFFKYCQNYSTKFINGKSAPNVFLAWDKVGHVQSHLINKWVLLSQGKDGTIGIINLYHQLDIENQDIFMNWITKNYKG